MPKLTLSDLANLQNETTAVTTLTANNTAIEDAMENTLSRDGTSPNQMNADFDMNSNSIINLPAAINDDEPVRKAEFDDAIDSLSGGSLAMSTTGIVVSLPSNNATTRTIQSGTGVDVSNGDGVSGDPSIAISAGYPGQTSITTLGTVATGTWHGTKVGLPYGGTNIDMSATGGTSQVLKQSTLGGNVSVGQIAVADLSDTKTGTGNIVLQTSPTLITPALGTPSAAVLTNATGLPITTGVSGLGTGVATFLATPSSANLATALTDETGSGSSVFATSPVLVTPTIGAATATSVNKVAITAPATSATLTIPDGVTLTGPAASGTAMTLGNNETVTGVKTFGVAGNVGKLAVAGSGSGSTVIAAQAAASGTMALPAATSTIVGTDVAQTLTNKTIVGSSNTISSVALSSLATQAAYTFVGNNTGSAAVPTAVDIATLTSKASPAASDLIFLSDQAASGAWKKATVASVASAGSVASIAGNTGAFTLANGITNNVNSIELTAARRTLPTRQTFTSSSGTYTTPANCLWIEVEMVGGGGGGGGSSTGTSTNGGAGGNTTFSTLAANGGGGGVRGASGGTAGTASGGDINASGATGGAFSTTTAATGGPGGNSFFGGGACGTSPGGNAGAAGTTYGGGGAGASLAGAGEVAAGGGSGGYCRKIINTPAATYSYAVGAAGTAGTAGTSGQAGGAGFAGIIIVTEHYGS